MWEVNFIQYLSFPWEHEYVRNQLWVPEEIWTNNTSYAGRLLVAAKPLGVSWPTTISLSRTESRWATNLPKLFPFCDLSSVGNRSCYQKIIVESASVFPFFFFRRGGARGEGDLGLQNL